MKRSNAIELGLTIPLQRHLHIKALPYPQEPDRRFCWDPHVIPLRGKPSLLAVHCCTRYTCVLYDLTCMEWVRLLDVFLNGLRLSLSADQLDYQFCRSTSVGHHTVLLWIQSHKD